MSKEGKELGTKSATAFMIQILGQIIGVVYIALAGRTVGVDNYGKMVYLIAFLNLFVVISKFGFENSLISYISRTDITREYKKNIIIKSITFSIIVALVVLAMLNFCGEAIVFALKRTEISIETFKVVAPVLAIETVVALLSAVIRGLKDIKNFYIGNNLVLNLSRVVFLSIFYFIFHIEGLKCLVYVLYCSYAVYLFFNICIIKKSRILKGNSESYPLRAILLFSLPMLFTGAVQMLDKEIDSYMVGIFIDSTSVAIYSFASNIGIYSSFTLLSVNSIFAPLISELYHENRLSELASLYKTSTKWITIINIMIFGMILVLPGDIMRIAGDEYAAFGGVLVVVMLGQIINSGVGSVGFLNTMTGHAKWNLISTLISLTINILLNLLLVKEFGVIGVAWATAISIGVNNIINFLFMYSHLHTHPYNKKYFGILISLIISIIPIIGLKYILNINYLLRIIVCGIVYAPLYAALIYQLACTDDEKLLFKNTINKVLKCRNT